MITIRKSNWRTKKLFSRPQIDGVLGRGLFCSIDLFWLHRENIGRPGVPINGLNIDNLLMQTKNRNQKRDPSNSGIIFDLYVC